MPSSRLYFRTLLLFAFKPRSKGTRKNLLSKKGIWSTYMRIAFTQCPVLVSCRSLNALKYPHHIEKQNIPITLKIASLGFANPGHRRWEKTSRGCKHTWGLPMRSLSTSTFLSWDMCAQASPEQNRSREKFLGSRRHKCSSFDALPESLQQALKLCSYAHTRHIWV